MIKFYDFFQFIIGFFSYSIIFIVLFSAFTFFTPSHAAEIKLVGCDIGFSSGSGKPIVMCVNPKYTKDELNNFDYL